MTAIIERATEPAAGPAARQEGRYLGKYRGIVASNIDPLDLGRLLVQVPDVLADDPCFWALPALPGVSIQAGLFALPPINTNVWVEFEQGNPDYAVWVGCFPGSTADLPALAAATPASASPIVLQTTGQHTVALSDLPGAAGGVLLKSTSGAFVSVSSTGIVLSNGKGAIVSLAGPLVTVNGGALIVK
jgi:Type VI secretion system/phage-baseplate injector OB domain